MSLIFDQEAEVDGGKLTSENSLMWTMSLFFFFRWTTPRRMRGVLILVWSSISGVTAGKSRVLCKSITSSARFELKMV